MINKLIFRPPIISFNKKVDIRHTSGSDGVPIYYILIRPAVKSEHVIIYSHGNAEDINSSYNRIKKLVDTTGVNILIYDYPGYGATRGRFAPSEEGCYDAIETIYQLLRTKYKFRTKNMILYGRSIGSGPTCHLATIAAVGGVILDSAFTSCGMVITKNYDILGELDAFRNLDKMDKVKSPTLIIHGKNDKLVPEAHADQLYLRLKSHLRYHLVKLYCGHNDVDTTPGYFDAVNDFVAFVTSVR